VSDEAWKIISLVVKVIVWTVVIAGTIVSAARLAVMMLG